MTYKLNKKILAILLALLLLAVCGGCGSAPAEEPQQEESAASTESETTTESTEPPVKEKSSKEEPEAKDSTDSSEAKSETEEAADSTDSSKTKSETEEPASAQSAAPPKYLVNYLGMTVSEIANIWGDDYTLTEPGVMEGGTGLHYDDLRTNLWFIIEGSSSGNANDKISSVKLWEPDSEPDLWIEEGVPCHVTLTDLEQMNLPGSPDQIELGPMHYWYDIGNHITVGFFWNSVYENANIELAYTDYPEVYIHYNGF